MRKTTKLQELFNREEIFVIAGGGCALHAKIAEATGFECAYMSGATTAAYVLGIPDAGLITMTEMVQNAERMANAISIPLISDSDQGFGTAINVRRTVASFVRAGVAGIHVEDQPFPKRCGFVKGKEIIPLEEAVGKYKAAVDAKNEIDPDFVIIARCDARGATGGSLEELITRLKAYKAVGVDVLYAEALTSVEEILTVRAEVEGPLMGTMGYIEPEPTPAQLQEWGWAASFNPGLVGGPGVQGSWEHAKAYREGPDALRDYEQRITNNYKYEMPHMFDIVGFPEVAEWEEMYLPEEQLKKYEDSIGGYDPRASRAPARAGAGFSRPS